MVSNEDVNKYIPGAETIVKNKKIDVLEKIALQLADKDISTESVSEIIRMVREYLKGNYTDISEKTIILGVATLLYVLSAVDIIPDVIPVIGFIDDIAVISWFIHSTGQDLEKFREWENQGAIDITPMSIPVNYIGGKAVICGYTYTIEEKKHHLIFKAEGKQTLSIKREG